MSNIKEKISAMYDGELNSSEIDELIEVLVELRWGVKTFETHIWKRKAEYDVGSGETM